MMWLATISSLICFAIATIMFTEELRSCPFYRPLALYFIFEGFWMLLYWVIKYIFGNSSFMMYVQYIFGSVAAFYLLYSIYLYYKSKKNN